MDGGGLRGVEPATALVASGWGLVASGWGLVAIGFALGAVWPAQSLADEPAPGGPVELRPADPASSSPREEEPRRSSKKDAHHYGWTSLDWVSLGTTVGATAALVPLAAQRPSARAAIGPSYQEGRLIGDRRSVSKTHMVGETVPSEVAMLGGLAVTQIQVGVGLFDAGESGWVEFRELHDLVGGTLESTAFTMASTEMTKISVGRLRPDFLSRVDRYDRCVASASEQSCEPLYVEAFDEGRVSFPSGHTSFAFSTAGFTALALGGRFIWGDRATDVSAPLAAVADLALLGTATFVGVSRVVDHWHNPSDVLAGMGLGLFWANVSYWSRFDIGGRSREGATRVNIVPGPGAFGVGFAAFL